MWKLFSDEKDNILSTFMEPLFMLLHGHECSINDKIRHAIYILKGVDYLANRALSTTLDKF